MAGRTSLTVYEGMTGMMENAFINIKNRSFSIKAEIEVPNGSANGVIICQGGRFGGWTLYLKDGKPIFTYNWLGVSRYSIASTQALDAGRNTVTLNFAYDGGQLGAGGTATLAIADKVVAQGRIDRTHPIMFSADEGADVGIDEGTPVTEDYTVESSKFTGAIDKVTINVQPLGANVKDKAENAAQQFVSDKAAED
jgi:arylsulfatase